jgi:hypothetical protein
MEFQSSIHILECPTQVIRHYADKPMDKVFQRRIDEKAKGTHYEEYALLYNEFAITLLL